MEANSKGSTKPDPVQEIRAIVSPSPDRWHRLAPPLPPSPGLYAIMSRGDGLSLVYRSVTPVTAEHDVTHNQTNPLRAPPAPGARLGKPLPLSAASGATAAPHVSSFREDLRAPPCALWGKGLPEPWPSLSGTVFFLVSPQGASKPLW